ncbi:IS701-like element ISSiac1 family transposase [Singulisphaera acidiphila]|uniref:Transposase family protein n=6 Tax=Singulisphaera acidiphila TaxID=466153 RepID=H1N2D6_SINAD|nr:IS701-like element ISSiac1 family transposase [Singulisphaera acidiphila]AGA25232.1 transposase family protein [Singulisphaera acidiphila DSM 18658]AGA25363.1 transposase family protein [Singulisphaera acidiphila DSM 18658]AGA27449.1 transposase family protein [Singulisphaera acidiphila DSM 18658]AGA30233.1 transposase family protein [Singulisphaera acidiphila DSM 18658]AGA30847.1 transposase family protein [Singulisphaera acidiphila DSM 18658]
MPGIIEFPKLVEAALTQHGDLFANECQRRHFAEYLTGLFVADRKTVLGIHDEFAQTTDQSCLNRFLTAAQWDPETLNDRRLEQLQKEPSTRYSVQGVIPIDNTLVDRDGMLIPDANWFWDHTEERNKIAQDYLFVNYVCTSGKHYPLEFRLFRKQEVCEALDEPFRNHTALCCELIDWVCERGIPGDFAMDCYFTNAEVLNHIDGKQDRLGRPHGYVGDLKTNRKLEWKGGILKANELAASIPVEDRKAMRIGDRRQWYFTVTVRIPGVNHKVRIVILWHYRNDGTCCKILVTNRITWEVSRIVRVYRHRWTGTETFHRDGKQQLGLGDCQLRDVQGQTRHMYLVMLAYSLLMSELKQGRAKEWALHRLMTIGEACRAMTREALRTTLSWAIEQVTQFEQPYEHVVAQLGLS